MVDQQVRSTFTLVPLEGVEAFVGVADEGQAQLRLLLIGHVLSLSAKSRGVIGLVDLVGREVGDVDVGAESGLERSADAAQLVPDDTAEEAVLFDLVGTFHGSTGVAETVRGVAEKAEALLAITKLDRALSGPTFESYSQTSEKGEYLPGSRESQARRQSYDRYREGLLHRKEATRSDTQT